MNSNVAEIEAPAKFKLNDVVLVSYAGQAMGTGRVVRVHKNGNLSVAYGEDDPSGTVVSCVDSTYCTQRRVTRTPVPPTPATLALARRFLRLKWAERARELGRPEPTAFASVAFGGRAVGDATHEYTLLAGVVIDITDWSEPLPPHDPAYWRSREHARSLRYNEPRIRDWIAEWRELSKSTDFVRGEATHEREAVV